MKIFKILLICFLPVFASSQKLTETKHGYRGKYVEASRVNMNKTPGLMFSEINFRGMIGRLEIDQIITTNNGFVLDNNAVSLNIVVFKDVNTRQQFDSTIKVVLPLIEQWYNK